MASARFAKLISEASSPFVVIPLFGLFITAHYSSSLIGFLGWYALFVLLAVGVPLGYVSWGAKARRVTDWHVIVHGQRLGPMLLATTGAAVLSILHEVLDAPHGLLVMSLILAANGVIFTAIAHFWKISIHAAAYAGGVLLLAGLVGWAWLWLALLLPVIVWAGSNWSAQYPARLAAVAIVSANVLILLYLL